MRRICNNLSTSTLGPLLGLDRLERALAGMALLRTGHSRYGVPALTAGEHPRDVGAGHVELLVPGADLQEVAVGRHLHHLQAGFLVGPDLEILGEGIEAELLERARLHNVLGGRLAIGD